MKTEIFLDGRVLVNISQLLSDMENTTWNHLGDREASNVGYRITSESTFQGAKAELEQLLSITKPAGKI